MYPDATKTLREVERIISLNPGIYRELVSIGVPEAKIVAIPNGVDVDLFKPSEEVRKLMRSRIGCDSSTPVFLCTTRFAPKKRLPKLLQAWKEIEKHSDDFPSPELWIVGGNNSEFSETKIRRQLIQMIGELRLQHVRLFASEPHSEMPKYYQSADIYVSFSEEEGMSNSMLEAMSTGLIVIGPCVDAVTQLVENRINGFLFGHENGNGPTDAIRTCIQLTPTQRRQIGMTNRLLMCERYKIDQVATQFSKLFDQLILHSQKNTEI
jgi:glycosyltransferase involved in cell wall biosynthesis